MEPKGGLKYGIRLSRAFESQFALRPDGDPGREIEGATAIHRHHRRIGYIYPALNQSRGTKHRNSNKSKMIFHGELKFPSRAGRIGATKKR